MNIEGFVVCDSFSKTNGKLNLHGIKDKIFVDNFPEVIKYSIAVLISGVPNSKHIFDLYCREGSRIFNKKRFESKLSFSGKSQILFDTSGELNHPAKIDISLCEGRNILKTTTLYIEEKLI